MIDALGPKPFFSGSKTTSSPCFGAQKTPTPKAAVPQKTLKSKILVWTGTLLATAGLAISIPNEFKANVAHDGNYDVFVPRKSKEDKARRKALFPEILLTPAGIVLVMANRRKKNGEPLIPKQANTAG